MTLPRLTSVDGIGDCKTCHLQQHNTRAPISHKISKSTYRIDLSSSGGTMRRLRLVLIFIGLLKRTPTKAFSNRQLLRTPTSESHRRSNPSRQSLHYRTQQRMANANANMTEFSPQVFGVTLEPSNSWIIDESSPFPQAQVQRDEATVLDTYWGPRIVLGLVPLLYGKHEIYNVIIVSLSIDC